MTTLTISAWIKNVLRVAGIDTKSFKVHSTRSASKSKAGLAGLPVTVILEKVSWTKVSTWQLFYNKIKRKNTKIKFYVKIFEQERRNGPYYDKRPRS